MADLSALLTYSKNLTSHLSRPDLPSVNLSLPQIEALSRRLVSRQPGTSTDTDRACVWPKHLYTKFPLISWSAGTICWHKHMSMHQPFPARSRTSTLRRRFRRCSHCRILTSRDIFVSHTSRTSSQPLKKDEKRHKKHFIAYLKTGVNATGRQRRSAYLKSLEDGSPQRIAGCLTSGAVPCQRAR